MKHLFKTLLFAAGLVSCCFSLSGCSMTLPVRGQSTSGAETFTGTATGGIDGSGTIDLRSSKGATVTGDFVYINSRQGEGTFITSDGRTGPFSFVSTGVKGTGTGKLGDETITFTFGGR